MQPPEFTYVTYIQTTPEQLWRALTDGDITRHYWDGLRLESDWQIGSPLTTTDPHGNRTDSGEVVLEADPPHRLSYTFNVADHDVPELATMAHEPASRVTFDLTSSGNATRLTLVHDHFTSHSNTYESVREGWPMILSGLKTYLETGNTLHADEP